jgi:hypothetical protein
MGILLAFAPFIVFVIVERTVGATPALIAAAAVSAAMILRDLVGRGRSTKVLEIGTFVLFAGLGVYAVAAGVSWPILGVRLRVDGGLLLIVLISILIRRPFTLQYAREQVARELWGNPEFIRTNYIITAVWALAFAVMVAADVLMLYRPDVPMRVGIIVTVAVLLGAIKFTSWYPERRQAALAP